MAAMAKSGRKTALSLVVLLCATAVGARERVAPMPPRVDAPVESRLPPQSWAYGASGVLLLGGLGFGFWARGETMRAKSLDSAKGSADMMRSARRSAATANVMYGLAGLSLAYGLALQFLPPKTADKVDLTVNF